MKPSRRLVTGGGRGGQRTRWSLAKRDPHGTSGPRPGGRPPVERSGRPWRSGGFTPFRGRFLADLPARLTGPGRLRFICSRSWRSSSAFVGVARGCAGLSDRRICMACSAMPRAGADTCAPASRRSGTSSPSAPSWMPSPSSFIFRQIHPGAALVVGPVLITLPYALAQGITIGSRAARPAGPRLPARGG